MTRVSRHLDAEQITGYVEINPEDAVSLNIKEGDSVVLSSRRGRMEAPARLSGAVKPGQHAHQLRVRCDRQDPGVQGERGESGKTHRTIA